MPFLAIFRKGKEPSTASRRSRPSIDCGSPPPQLANLSPQSDFEYVLPDIDELPVDKPQSPVDKPPSPKQRRGLPFGRRRESATATPPRPFSEAFDAFIQDKQTRTDRDSLNRPKINSHSNLNSNPDSDDDPLVLPSVFAGFIFADDRPRAASAPDAQPPASEKHKVERTSAERSVDKSEMLRAKKPKDTSKGGLFGWRSKSAKAVSPAPDSSFSLKGFRHVGPNTSGDADRPSTSTPTTLPTSATTLPTSTTTSPPPRPVPGRSGTGARERVNSTSSEGMMTAGLFRQAVRRSSTNLVEDAAEPIRTKLRDQDRRGPPTRAWDVRDDPGAASSGSERPVRPPRARPSNAWLDSESERDAKVPAGPRKSLIQMNDDEDSTPESPSPFAGRLGGRDSPFSTGSDGHAARFDSITGTRSDSGHGSRVDYSVYGARSDGGVRSGSKLAPARPRPSSPAKLSRPSLLSDSTTLSSSPPRLSLGLELPDKPLASSPPKAGPRPFSPTKRSGSPTKPRMSAPAATRPTRSPVRTTIPTKTNDGPSIKPGRPPASKTPRPPSPAKSSRALGHGRQSSGDVSLRSVSVDVVSHVRRPSGFEVVSRPKSPGPAASFASGPKTSIDESRGNSPRTTETPRVGYVPPPRGSSLVSTLVDSDSDESPEEGESESEDLGVGKKAQDVKGRNSTGNERSGSDERQGLSRERTITQRNTTSPPAPPPKIGVSLFDKPMPKFEESPVDRFGVPPGPIARTRASHSTSAISAAATARNSAAIAEANRALGPGKHGRQASFGAASIRSHVRSAAETTDTDEDEDEEESESDDNAPLSTLTPARRPDSAASTAPTTRSVTASRPSGRPSVGRPPLVNLNPTPAPPRPPRRGPTVGVTRNSSLRGSRSVEDLGRVTKGSAVPRPGPRPFAASPPSSTGDSSSGKAPLTPRDGSESGARRSDESRRKERRRSEAKASVDLANVINGPGPVDDDDDGMSAHHSQMGHGMGMLGLGMGYQFPPGQQMGFSGFPASQSMPFLHPQLTGPQPMGFMPPPPPPGASEAYLAAHQQAMMIAKQTYLSAVAQQAMAAATEQWERSSNMGGSVYGGSAYGGSAYGGSAYGGSQMGMMGMPMMGMYPGSSYAASSYEPSLGGWGSGSVYGGPSGMYSARSDYGGKSSPTKGALRVEGHTRARSRTHTSPSDTLAPPSRSPVPPSTWATRRKGS